MLPTSFVRCWRLARHACLDERAAARLALDAKIAAHEVDPRLPDIEAGIALIAGMARAWPTMRIVLTGWSDTAGHGQLDATETAYVSKSATPEQFTEAIVLACSAA